MMICNMVFSDHSKAVSVSVSFLSPIRWKPHLPILTWGRWLESCLAAMQGMDSWSLRCFPIDFFPCFFHFSVHVASRCWIYPAFINRRFWQGGKQSYPIWIRSIALRCTVCFFSPRTSVLFFSRTAIRDVHCCNGWLFLSCKRCCIMLACFLIPLPCSADILDGLLCSPMIPGSANTTPWCLYSFISSGLLSWQRGDLILRCQDKSVRRASQLIQ